MYECPICGKDCLSDEARKLSRELIKNSKHKLISEYANPGGRELIFDFGSIQLFDCCCWCDYETLKEELTKHK